MPAVMITLKSSATDDQIKQVKDNITSSGGSIKSDFELVKGFTAEVPDGMVGVLSSDDLIENVEEDANVSIQQ
ncbi:protease B inhibitors 2 and 1 [Aspergillus udagawae]|nr:protease B inhibitors 2 and 1 [Aspergillus udagawae]